MLLAGDSYGGVQNAELAMQGQQAQNYWNAVRTMQQDAMVADAQRARADENRFRLVALDDQRRQYQDQLANQARNFDFSRDIANQNLKLARDQFDFQRNRPDEGKINDAINLAMRGVNPETVLNTTGLGRQHLPRIAAAYNDYVEKHNENLGAAKNFASIMNNWQNTVSDYEAEKAKFDAMPKPGFFGPTKEYSDAESALNTKRAQYQTAKNLMANQEKNIAKYVNDIQRDESTGQYHPMRSDLDPFVFARVTGDQSGPAFPSQLQNPAAAVPAPVQGQSVSRSSWGDPDPSPAPAQVIQYQPVPVNQFRPVPVSYGPSYGAPVSVPASPVMVNPVAAPVQRSAPAPVSYGPNYGQGAQSSADAKAAYVRNLVREEANRLTAMGVEPGIALRTAADKFRSYQ